MKKNVQKYLSDARQAAHENFLHADGNFAPNFGAGGNQFKGATGGYAMANGGAMASAPTSQPYVINVTSTSGVATANVDILGSNEYLGSGNFVSGDYVDGGITISSGIPGVTYQQMLYQFQQQPFSVGLTYYQSATTGQVLQTLQVVTKDANGTESKKPMIPTIDPYQYQSGIITIKQGYNVDGYTKVTIASVLANATITFQLYPADKVNLAAGLEGKSVAAGYANPGIVKAQEVVLK